MNIKISLGTQTMSSGSFILSQSTSISINQMNIISKSNCKLTVNGQLNILTSQFINANITNLLVNLSFASSTGNITLINNINSVLNISGYQVLGSYISTGTVAMIGITLNSATINVNMISLKLTEFNVGNCSSYLFGNAITTKSVVSINNFAIILGNSLNYILFSSISTLDKNNNYYLFGGTVAYINSNSVLSVNNMIVDSYQHFSTSFVSNSGFLVGYIDQTLNILNIQNICMQQIVTSISQQFNYCGLIGRSNGQITSIHNASITFQVQASYFHCFGIIGLQVTSSIYAEIVNIRTFVSFNFTTGSYLGSIFGAEESQNCTIQNTTVIEGNISFGSDRVGGFSGDFYQNATIYNSTVQKLNISGTGNVGGFTGFCYLCTLYLINSKIQYVRISGSSGVGIVSGANSGNVYISNSSSIQNLVNNVQRSDCAVLSNWSSGC
ncbi:Hypothetical_protein [Hexamita inflata]|nr:Hypothetical protein HINF_LOCUS56962 [Hexamita inflata]